MVLSAFRLFSLKFAFLLKSIIHFEMDIWRKKQKSLENFFYFIRTESRQVGKVPMKTPRSTIHIIFFSEESYMNNRRDIQWLAIKSISTGLGALGIAYATGNTHPALIGIAAAVSTAVVNRYVLPMISVEQIRGFMGEAIIVGAATAGISSTYLGSSDEIFKTFTAGSAGSLLAVGVGVGIFLYAF